MLPFFARVNDESDAKTGVLSSVLDDEAKN
jgi:hypothetical protein